MKKKETAVRKASGSAPPLEPLRIIHSDDEIGDRPYWSVLFEKILERNGLSLSAVAARAKISKSTIHKWINGEPPAREEKQQAVYTALRDLGLNSSAMETIVTGVIEAGGVPASAAMSLMKQGIIPQYAGFNRLTIEEASMRHQVLTERTMKHFSISKQPFGDLECRADAYVWPELDAACRHIIEVITRSTSMLVLTGPTGAGKTTLMRLVTEELEQNYSFKALFPALLDLKGLNETAIQRIILDAAGDNKSAFTDAQGRGSRSRAALARMRKQHKLVLWVDQAEDLDSEGMIMLKRHNEERDGWQKLVSIVLSGQPQVRENFSNAKAAQFAIRAELLEMPSVGDAGAFLAFRLRSAGLSKAEIERVWPDTALAALNLKAKALKLGSGSVTPRQIENLAAIIMNYVAEVGDPCVTPSAIEHVQDKK